MTNILLTPLIAFLVYFLVVSAILRVWDGCSQPKAASHNSNQNPMQAEKITIRFPLRRAIVSFLSSRYFLQFCISV